MPATFVTSFKSVAQKLRGFDYTTFQVLWIVAKISKFEKAVILSKMIVFFPKREGHMYSMSVLSEARSETVQKLSTQT